MQEWAGRPLDAVYVAIFIHTSARACSQVIAPSVRPALSNAVGGRRGGGAQ
jgi:hypothetical protein